MKDKLVQFFSNAKVISWVYVFILFLVSGKSILSSLFKNHSIGDNYLVFKFSFERLVNNQSMYVFFTKLDLFKYSPTFATWMLPFYYLNDYVGVFIWIALNAFVVYFAFKKLANINQKYIVLALWFILNELVTSLMNCQTNPLILGLIVLSFLAIENKNIALSTFLILVAFFIKPYALAICVIYIFYENKLKIVLFSLFWFLVLAALPLLFVSIDSYIFQLNEWQIMLKNDHSASYGMSVMGVVKNVLGFELKNQIMLFGLLFLFVPLLKVKYYTDFLFRIKYIASILIWMIIFNHKAESPTYIIAVGGVALWFFYSDKNVINLVLLLFVLFLTQLSPTDIFPKFIRDTYIKPYELKALPCILVWIKINIELLFYKNNKKDITEIG